MQRNTVADLNSDAPVSRFDLMLPFATILSLGKIASDWGGASMRLAKRGIANTYVMKFGTATINESQHEWCKRFAKAV